MIPYSRPFQTDQLACWLRRRGWSSPKEEDEIVSANVCPFCANALVQSTQHQWFCPQCGHVANNAPLEDQAEWRAGLTHYGFDVGGGLDRCGVAAHPLFHTFDDDGTTAPRKQSMLRSALQKLQDTGSQLQASGLLVNRACYWLRQWKLHDHPSCTRLTSHALTSACLWIAAREYNQLLSFEQTCSVPAKIQRTVSMLDQFRLTFQPSAMDEQHPTARAASTMPLRMVKPITLIDHWLHELPGFTAVGKQLALFIAMRIERYKLIVDHLPPAIAASILWFVSYQLQAPAHWTKRMLAMHAKVTVVTMDMCLRKMELKRRWFFPDRFFAFRERRTYHATARPLVAIRASSSPSGSSDRPSSHRRR